MMVKGCAKLRVVPVTRDTAHAFIRRHHRHLTPPPGEVLRAAIATTSIVGVALAGRPVARRLNDGLTLEITRVAVLPGVPNGCSMLYGALRRAARALGWRRFVTYTLSHESGSSLRAAGWVMDGHTRGGAWSRAARPRPAAANQEPKTRWVWAVGGHEVEP